MNTNTHIRTWKEKKSMPFMPFMLYESWRQEKRKRGAKVSMWAKVDSLGLGSWQPTRVVKTTQKLPSLRPMLSWESDTCVTTEIAFLWHSCEQTCQSQSTMCSLLARQKHSRLWWEMRNERWDMWDRTEMTSARTCRAGQWDMDYLIAEANYEAYLMFHN